jgi:hypothetical protein
MKKWIEDEKEIEGLLGRALVGRLGLVDGDEPYVVPLNFVYDAGRIIFHCGMEGRKLEILEKNPKVCFEVDELGAVVVNDEVPCFSTAHYLSFIATGVARELDSNEEKLEALDLVMKKYAAGRDYSEIPEFALAIVRVWEIKIDKKALKASVPGEA